MNEKPPCLVYKHGPHVYIWNEDARIVYMGRDIACALEHAEALGYEPVSPNSRIAATIRDKFRQRGYTV